MYLINIIYYVHVHVEQLSVTHRELFRIVVLLRGVFLDSVMAIPGKSLEPVRCAILSIRLILYMHMRNTNCNCRILGVYNAHEHDCKLTYKFNLKCTCTYKM